MARPAPNELDEETIQVPRAVRFPVELTPPQGFDAERLETWPRVEGRLEWVDGRLLYMPPCGELQAHTVTDLVTILGNWVRFHREFVVGTNEAGMLLRGAARAADAAVWRRADVGPSGGGLARVPPILAVEVGSRDEPAAHLRDKARWYLAVGVAVVWLVFPSEREVLVLTASAESRHRMGERLPPDARVPDLAPRVDDIFLQISGREGLTLPD
jgi:Uma2 family endonuclease